MNRPKLPSRLPIYLLLALTIALLVFYYMRPVPLSDDIEDGDLFYMRIVNEANEYDDVTDLIHQEKVIEIIGTYSRDKLPFQRKTMSIHAGDLSLWIHTDTQSYHLYLYNCSEDPSSITLENRSYYINDPQTLIHELHALIPNET